MTTQDAPKSVQAEQVPPAGTGSTQAVPAAVTPPVEPPKPQPFTAEQEAKLQQLLADAVSRAKEQGKDLGKREMQGIKDKEVAEAQRRARLAEAKASAFESGFEGLDEDSRQKAELAYYKKQAKTSQDIAQEEEAKRKQDEQAKVYFEQLDNSLKGHLTELGIDPNDKEVDWAKDAPDYLDGRKRFDASVAKIIKRKEKEAETKLESKWKDMELKLRKDLGLDSVDMTAGSAPTSDGIPTDSAKLREWIEAMPTGEYIAKYADKVKEMRRQGKIK